MESRKRLGRRKDCVSVISHVWALLHFLPMCAVHISAVLEQISQHAYISVVVVVMSCRLTFSYVSNFVPPSHSSIVIPAYFSVCVSAHNLLIMDFTVYSVELLHV